MNPPRTTRLLPLIFPLLAVLGIVLMIVFAAESTPTAAIDLSVGRAEAQRIAAEFLRRQGDDPAARWSTVSYQFDSDAQSYLLREAGRATLNERAQADLDLAHWQVRFWRPLDPDEWIVSVSSATGRVSGYAHTIRAEQPGATLAITAAEQLAAQALPVPPSQLTLIARTTTTQPERADHVLTWERRDLRDGEARYRYSVRVQGDQIGLIDEYYWLPDSWWRESAWQGRRGVLLSTVGWTITYGLTALIGFTWLLLAQRGRLRRRWASTLFGAVLVLGVLVMLNSIPLELASYDVNTSLPLHLLNQLSGYLSQLVTLAATIVLAGMAGEALVWERTNGALQLGQTLTRRGLVSRPTVQALLIGGLIGVGQLGFVSLFYALGGRWFGVWSPVTALYDDTLSTPFPALYALAVGLLPAVGEELLFRLGGITVLTRWTGKPKLAIVFTAIVWASLHATYAQRPFFIRVLELSLVGIVFGALFVRYGVLASMAAHFTYNASLYVPLFWGGSLLYLISGVLAAGAVALLLIPALLRAVRRIPLEPDSAVALPLPPSVPEAPPDLARAAPRHDWRRLAASSAVALVALGLVGWTLAPALRRTDTRSGAIAKAQTAAASLGVDLTGLYPSAQPVADWVDLDLSYLYDELDLPAAATAVREVGHPRAWMVRWLAWDRPDSWQVDLGPGGDVLAYSRSIPEDTPGAALARPAAQALAAAAAQRQVDLAQYELLDAGAVQRTARTDHTFTWQTRQTVVGAAYQRIDVVVQGDQVAAITPSLYTPPAYRRQRDQITFAESFVNKVPAALTEWPTFILPIIGLVGVLRRQVAVRPWAWLGLAGGMIWLLLGIGRLTQGQVAEGPRLIQGLSWALMDGVLNGGQLALLAAGAATAWRMGARSKRRPSDVAIGESWRYSLADALQRGWLLVPWLLLFVLARAWPAAKPGLFAASGALGSLLPAFDSLGRAVLGATTTTLTLAGAFGLLKALATRWRFSRLDPALTALLLTTFGMLLASISLREPGQIALALLAWPVATWLGAQTHGNLLAVWWGLLVLRLLPAGLALAGAAGPIWYVLNGGLLLLGLAMSAGWTAGRLIERRGQR
jgi:membrane protease YdiL (CAAX protease family)